MATIDQRDHMRAVMRMLIDNEPLVHYRQRRPMLTLDIREQVLADRFHDRNAISMDCSEAVVLICQYCGLADPTGNNYNGYGNTQSMLDNNMLRQYTNPTAAEVGAIVILGPDHDAEHQHACLVMDAGTSDPMLFSHGQERGPLRIRLSAEKKFHLPPTRFLSIARL